MSKLASGSPEAGLTRTASSLCFLLGIECREVPGPAVSARPSHGILRISRSRTKQTWLVEVTAMVSSRAHTRFPDTAGPTPGKDTGGGATVNSRLPPAKGQRARSAYAQ